MKKSLILIISALALAVTLVVCVPSLTNAAAHYVEPCQKSILCAGLIEHFNLDEATGNTRYGAFMSRLFENDGQNIVCNTNTSPKFGTCALELSGINTYLWTRTPGLTGSFSIGFWFSYSSNFPPVGQQYSILSWDNATFPGTDVYLDNQAGITKLCISTKTAENDTLKTLCSGSVSPFPAWHYGVVGASLYHTGQDHIFVSLDGGTKATTATTYWTQGGMAHLRFGQRPINGPDVAGDRQCLAVLLDHLDFWSRPLSPAEITLLYNAGNGRAYPYDTD